MSVGGARRSLSIGSKLFLLLAAPLLLVVAAELGIAGRLLPRGAADDERHAHRIRQSFAALLADLERVARSVLDDSPTRAWGEVKSRPGPLGRRVEGVGLLGPDLELLSWSGMPGDPPAALARGWAARVDGVRTRLFARAGPDGAGRIGLVSFLLDSTLDDLAFADLLPDEVRDEAQLVAAFDVDLALPAERRVALQAPDGAILGVVQVVPTPGPQLTRRVRQLAAAWAALLFVGLLACLFPWGKSCRSRSGLLLAGLAIAVGRALLLWQNAPGRLLPRELGSASHYGSLKLWGLIESPADLLLTGALIYLACAAARIYCANAGARRAPAALLFSSLAALAATVTVAGMALSLSRNSRIPLLERPAPFEWDARLALWIGLLLPALAAAELWTTAWSRRERAGEPAAPSALGVALILVVLCAGASLTIQRQSERLAVERLRSEYATQVLEQTSRRELALTEALAGIARAHAAPEVPDAWERGGAGHLAYRSWVGSELFHGRYKSSIDFHTIDGAAVDHFGFGLPPLDESIPSIDTALRTERIGEVGSVVQPRLLHLEAALGPESAPYGVAVGHVLDESDNLPFLPWSQTYIAALGPGVPQGGAEAPGGGVDYVLYDASGEVSLSTLLQPPGETRELRQAATRGRTLRLTAGDEPFVALALPEPDGRLHLLLLPEWTAAERLGAIVRLALLGLSLFALVRLIPRLAQRGGLRELASALRGSFYRKLVAALLLASIVPLVGLALFLRGYLDRRGDAALVASATQVVSAAQRIIEDYSAEVVESDAELTDGILHWLRRIVGQEIHLFRDGRLQASTTRELFDSGLLPERLDGEVQRRLVEEGLPYLVTPMSIGSSDIPVAYAPVRQTASEASQLVVAVPLVLEVRQIARSVSRVAEMILLATVALVGLLAVAAGLLARTVARPVRDLVEATGRIAAGDYGARLSPRTEDEVAELVHGFNAMAAALAHQRADLERRRDYIETLVRHATTGVISLDTSGRVVTLNPAAQALLEGAPLAIGAAFGDALAATTRFAPLARALDAARPGEPVDADLAADEPRRLRGVRVNLANVDGECFGTLILIEDVTELMRSNQLAAWAEMARAIAHEIKNPLTPIQLSTEHLARLLGDRAGGATAGERACLETIIKQVRTLHGIAGEFSAYAKLPVLQPQPTDPVAFMRGVVAPYRASCPPGLTIEERYVPAPAIAADVKVLSRAFVNLIENGLQAMPGGGTLTVAVAPGTNGGVELSVADTGPGLDPEARRRLFEPYFSTKSSGTGLGLAIARRAVEAHGGVIEAASARARGTTFRISIPARSAR